MAYPSKLNQNGMFEVDYTVYGLPYNAPLYVTVADSYRYPAWVHSGFGKTVLPVLHPKVFESSGWQGFVTIYDPRMRRLVEQRAPFRIAGPQRPAPPARRLPVRHELTNPSGYGSVANIDWIWTFARVLPPGLTPIRLIAPGEAVQRFGSGMGRTTKAGG